ncbi:MAG: metalloregulator ArsR/SmtB family transcription factor [Candidatus Diapherotrites archaeon]|nr:metalloregulator ArsR/SmtB family transcription factor [Candidatus Diapherotrites archaeon]
MKHKPYSKCFRVLSSDLRIKIIASLHSKSMSVKELSESLGEERSKVSHALRRLKECGFVKSKRDGKSNIYVLTKSILNDVKKEGNLFDIIEEHVRKKCNKGRRCF